MAAERFTRWASIRVAVALCCLFLISCQGDSELDTEEVLSEAVALVGEGKYAEGLEKMRALVEAKPDDLRVQRYYGEALLASGQPSLAVWPLSRAMRDPEQLVDAGLLLARAQSASGSGIDAIRTATRVLEVDPKNEAALLIRAQAHLGENLEERALEDIDLAEDLGGDLTTLEVLRLDALLGLGKEKEAEALLGEMTKQADEMREDDPANAARLCAATATFTAERGQVDDAEKRFEKCLEGDGIDYGILVNTAVDFYDKHGKPEKSTEIYKRRFERTPDRLETRVMYADRLQRTGKMKEGETLLLEVVAKQKVAWTALADLYAIDGDVPKALDALDKAIAASPVEREDWAFSRADFLLALGRIDEAEKTLAGIETPAHHELLAARIAAARGQLEEAAKHFESGIQLWPDNPDARYLAARTYERMGKWKEAAGHLREAARMEPPHYASSIELAELQRALGDDEGVSFLLLRLAEKHPQDAKIVEKLIEFASDTNDAELGVRLLTVLSGIRGKAGRAVALAADRMELTEGADAALAMIDKAGLDLSAPENVDALEARVRLLAGQERGDEAMALIEKAATGNADSARLQVLRASVHRKRGEADRAIAALEEARKLDAAYLPALLDLAAMHAAAGRRDAAKALYQEAIPVEAAQTKPEAPGGESKAALELARIEIGAGEVDSARRRLRSILDDHPRQGNSAWLLLKTYSDGADAGALDDATRRDLALRASVFERSPEARDYWKKLNESDS